MADSPPPKVSGCSLPENLLFRLENRLGRLWRQPDSLHRFFPLLLLLFTLFVWAPALLYGLEMTNPDDYYHLTSMARAHSPSDIAGWFKYGYWAYNHFEYRPLTRVGLLLTYLVFGPRLLAFHLTNILLHFVCALLAGAILARLGVGKWPARLAAAVWVVFPQSLMAVRWINGRQEVQCAALILLAVGCFIRWLEGKSFGYFVAAGAAVQLAAFTKEPGAVTPLFLLVLAFAFPYRRSPRQRLAAVGALGLLLLPYLYLRFRAYPLWQTINDSPWRTPGDELHSFARLLLFPAACELFTTLRQLGWLVIFSPNRNIWLAEQLAFWAGLALLLRRHPRLLLAAIAWKIIFWLPVMKVYWNPAFTHYRYIPNLATAWLVGTAGWELGEVISRRLRPLLRPALRWGLVAGGLLLLFSYYWTRLGLGVTDWRQIAAGGPRGPRLLWKELVCKRGHGISITQSEAEPPCSPEEYLSHLRPPDKAK
jgi:hypothetical protein